MIHYNGDGVIDVIARMFGYQNVFLDVFLLEVGRRMKAILSNQLIGQTRC